MEGRSPITGLPFHECIPTLRQRKIKITVNVKGLSSHASGVSTGGVMSGVWFAHVLPRHTHASQNLRHPPTTFGEVVKGHPSGWELKGRPAQAGTSEAEAGSDDPARDTM